MRLSALAGLAAVLSLVAVCLLGCAEATNPVEDAPSAPGAMPGEQERPRTGDKEHPLLVFFTDPQYPDDPADHQGGLDRTLAADVARARSTVDVAAYDFDLESVADAMMAAHKQGVRVRLVIESDNAEEAAVLSVKSVGIEVVEDGRNALMHNKFVIIDEAIVWTGSWNLTESGTYRNNNNAVRIVSELLAENYVTEFEEMFDERAFGTASPADTPHAQVLVGRGDKDTEVLIESYFGPEDQVTERLVALVREAEDSIRFMAFVFTDDDLGEAVIAQHEAGLTVQGVFEERNADLSYSEFGRMYGAEPRMDVRLDGNTYMMHHKVIILDDEKVIVGSFNFSRSADEANDENLLVIHDREVVSQYLVEFKRIYREASEGR
jgi:phosphatidylserine/phosphatidylglycerophosphate/cardiolipin synthase-like enzyme